MAEQYDHRGPYDDELEQACMACKGAGEIEIKAPDDITRRRDCKWCGGSGLLPTDKGELLWRFIRRYRSRFDA